MGDPACWLSGVCPECGAINDDETVPRHAQRTCWRCGTDLDDDSDDADD